MAIINAGPAERRNDLNLYLTASFFALLHMVILSAKCHANQCETFRRATISWRVGYENVDHFAKLFMRHVGCSPNDYRKQFKNSLVEQAYLLPNT